jgi:hypothetical protein
MERSDALFRENSIGESLEPECLETLRYLGFDGYKLAPLADFEKIGAPNLPRSLVVREI